VTSEVRSYQTAATDPYERGCELGADNAAAVHEAYARYTELWAAYGVTPDEVSEVGAAVLTPIEAFSPALSAEIAGIASGAGLEGWQVGALNARTELLALGDQRLVTSGRLPGEVAECSTLVRLPRAGDPLTAQTWDWHTPLTDSWFVWTLRLPTGRQVCTLTEYGIVGKIGVASQTTSDASRHGVLGLHFNAVRHRGDTGLGGVPVHLVARRILDEAQTTEQATAIAAEAVVSASAALTVTARGEQSAGWSACTLELHPGGPSVQLPSAGDGGRWLAHTNHFVAAGATGQDLPSAVSTTRERLDRVDRLAASAAATRGLVSAAPAPQGVADQLATHDLGPRSVCVHGFPDAPVGQRTATLAVAVVEPAAGRLHVHAGKPCEACPGTWWTGG